MTSTVMTATVMTATVMFWPPAGVAAARWRAAPDDPLGPNDVDPDTVRDLACSLTASDPICNPPTPPTTLPPDPVPPSDFGTASASAGTGSVGTLLVVLLVAALVAGLAWLVWVWWKDRTGSGSGGDGDEREGDEDEDSTGDVDDELAAERARPRVIDDERPPDRWRRAAAEHRAAGRFRDAVRCEYRALVGDLARLGVVDEIPGRTSGEERRQVQRLAPSASPAFERAAALFDQAWFGDEPTVADDDAAFRTAADDVLAAATPTGARR